MKRTLFALIGLLAAVSVGSAQTGVRVFGAQQFQLDDNIAGNPKGYLSLNLGSIGIDGTGIVNGTFPNTNALLTLLAGTKTTNLRIDGGSTWGIDIVNTNNGMRSAGLNTFGDGVGADNATFNLGTGNLIINTLPSPALPSPLANVVYMNGTNQMQMTPGGINIVTGSGTTNKLPLWTPNGNQLGNSYLTQSTNVAGGTLTSSERVIINSSVGGINTVQVNNFDNASTGIAVSANSGTGVNISGATTGASLSASTTGLTAIASGATTSLIGVSGTSTATAGHTGLAYGGSFTATAVTTSNQIDGVIAQANGAANGQVATGGAFFSSGSNALNLGVVGAATGVAGTNVAFQAQISGTNSVAYNVFGTPTTAFQTPTGNVILGSTVNTIASGGTIPNGQCVVDVNNNGVAASVATVTLPAGATNGQVVFVTTEDPDGVKVTVGLASVTISNAEVGRFMFINGSWRLEH